MVIDFISLIFLVIVNVLLVVSIFNFTRANVEDTSNNILIVDLAELGTLLVMVVFTINFVLTKLMDGASLLLINIISLALVISIWSVVRVPMIRDFFGIKLGIDSSTANNRLLNNVINNSSSNSNKSNIEVELEPEPESVYNKLEDDQVIFSKYIDKKRRNNFAFTNLFPDYSKQGKKVKKIRRVEDQDYSASNGYPEDHICNGCSCIEGEDGNAFCGKYVKGMGTIGCSCRWECMNCKECGQHDCDSTQTFQATDPDEFECRNCRCYKTKSGVICGKKDRIDGYVHKCNSSCKRCDKCYGADTSDLNSDAGMLTVDPYTSLNKVVLNNLDNVDINNII